MSRQRKKKGRPVSGWVVLDKPVGIGSTECVAKIKWLYQAQKAGHAGTLDPLASGMLPIALGEATKTVPYVMDGVKTYRFTVRWGAQTSTDDLEGEVVATSDLRPDEAQIRAVMAGYVGEIEQVPPAFSAVKIDGERAYRLARAGEAVAIEARPVVVHRFELVAVEGRDSCVLECECGKGTYVRALARDMGRDLGCLGHVGQLRRTAVGPFGEDDMIPLDELVEMEGDFAALDAELLPAGMALHELPEIRLTPPQASRLRAGNAILLRGRDAITYAEEAYATLGEELVAIGSVDKGAFNPRRVFKASAA
ncbi:MAG: tRNA pseudouridine synthase B [Alphaproteobacteria bacterium]|nr:MAG: tRNA pseudouridine synthase B [Alphaproteobacteria bacterium]